MFGALPVMVVEHLAPGHSPIGRSARSLGRVPPTATLPPEGLPYRDNTSFLRRSGLWFSGEKTLGREQQTQSWKQTIEDDCEPASPLQLVEDGVQ